MKELMKKLVTYHCWANLNIINHLKVLPEEVFLKEVDSVFPTISQTLGHVLLADQVWLSRILGKSPDSLNNKIFQSVEEADTTFKMHSQSFDSILDQLDEGQLIRYQTTKGDVFQQTLSEIIQHLVNHGTYHRGNIAAMIRQLGYTGTSTDYITFLRTRGE